MKLKTLLILWGIVAVSLMAETALAAKPECVGIESKSRGEQFKLKRLHGCEVPEVKFINSLSVEQSGKRDAQQTAVEASKIAEAAKHGCSREYPRKGKRFRRGRHYIEMPDDDFKCKLRKSYRTSWQKLLTGDAAQRSRIVLEAACYGTSTHLQQALKATGRTGIEGIKWSSSWFVPGKPYHKEKALHCAAWLGNFDKVKMLVKHYFRPRYQAYYEPQELAPYTPEGERIVGFLNEAEQIWNLLPENEWDAHINLLVSEYDRATLAEKKEAERVPTPAEKPEPIKKEER